MLSTHSETTALAARLIVEEGLDYGAAKRRAAKTLGFHGHDALPGNDALEAAVRDYLTIFCGDTQPHELTALRQLALRWMDRLTAFRPYVTGAVWNGTATRLSDVYLQLYCDDVKSAELALIDQGVRYQVSSVTGFRGEPVQALSVHVFCDDLNEDVGVHLLIHDHDEVRGALRPDAQGRSGRGDAQALRRLIAQEGAR